MTLAQLLSENPAAKIEYDAEMKAQFKAGADAGRESLQATISTAAKYLGPDGTYPAPIKSLAVDVLKGLKTAEALETTVSAFDALKESQKSEQAKTEGDKTGDTSGQQTDQLSPDGEMKTAADVMAQIKRDKLALGLEV